jgi:hypothetical protein
MNRSRVGAALATCLVTLTAACGGGAKPDAAPAAPSSKSSPSAASSAPSDSPSDSPSPAAAAGFPHAIKLVQALVEHNNFRTALKHASPGSVADHYLRTQKAIYDAQVTVQGDEPAVGTTVVDEAAHKITEPDPENGDTVFSRFTYDQSGLVTDFATGGKPIGPRLSTQPATVSAGHVRFRLVGAYRSSSALVVVLDAKASPGHQVETFGTPTYLDAARRQSTASTVLTPDGLQAGGSSLLLYLFPRAGLGGTMAWQFWPPNANGIDVHMKVS